MIPVGDSSVPAKIDRFAPGPSQNRFDPQVGQNARLAVSDEAYHCGVPVTSTCSRSAEVAATKLPEGVFVVPEG